MRKAPLTAFLVGCLFLGLGEQVAQAHGKNHNPSRHHYVMRQGIPNAYEGQLNPLRLNSEDLTNGQKLYAENCAVCHGPTGKGDGVSASVLNPAPPSLAGMYERPMQGMGHAQAGGHLMHGVIHHHPGMTHAEAMGGINLDAYNFWSVSEGGEAMGTAMPAFKQTLSEKERWQILLYIANGFSPDSSH